MSGKEYFATKLAAGTATATPATRWWPDHVAQMTNFMAAVSIGDPGRIKTILVDMGYAARDWGKIVGRGMGQQARSLMSEHMLFERRMLEAALSQSTHVVNSSHQLLKENLRDQVEAYRRLDSDFPHVRFLDLFGTHIGTLFELFSKCVVKGERGMDAAIERHRSNTLSLASFTAEWF